MFVFVSVCVRIENAANGSLGSKPARSMSRSA
jgi:hypothetical protein